MTYHQRVRLTLGPVLNVLDVLVGVLQIIQNLLAVRAQEVRLGSAALLDWHGPGSVLDTGGQVARKSVSVGSGKVEVEGTGWAVEGVEWVHGLHLTSIGIHAAGSLTRLDVSPNHRSHVTLVVHETSVEVGRLVWVRRHNVRGTTRERVLEEVEHGEELAWWHDHVVTKPTSNNRVVHNGLVGLVLEVRVPARAELLAWPAVHHLEFFLSGSDLDTSLDTVGSERTSAVDIPLLEDLFLDLGVTTDEVIE
jgi:hypothetical protein